MSTKSKISLSLILTAIAAALIFGVLSFLEARKSLRAAAFDELTAIRTARIDAVTSYFESVFDEANVITENPLVAEAVEDFATAYRNVVTDIPEADLAAAQDRLEEIYEAAILPDIAVQIDEGTPTYNAYAPQGAGPAYLQSLFIADANNNREGRDQVADTGGPTQYEQRHAFYHDELLFIVDEFEYYDLFLIDHTTGDIVYTVRKEADFATNIYDGPYRSSRLGEVVDKVKRDPNQGAVYMSDFEFYIPSSGTPAVFIASGIYEDNQIKGILAIQLTIADLNRIMTSGGDWSNTGLKETGETYIVGSDYAIRNESRFAVEDFDNYIIAIESIGTDPRIIERVKRAKSATMLQTVNTEGSREALAGRSDTRVIADYRGVDVLSAYAPLRIKDHDFALLAEIDAAEAFKPVRELLLRTAITAAIFIPLVAIFGFWIATALMKPARAMAGKARLFSQGDDETSFDEARPGEWGVLAKALNGVLASAREGLETAETARAQVREMAGQLMPSDIGARYLNGERAVTLAEKQASIAILRLKSDPAFHRLDDPSASREMFSRLDDTLDDLARRENVDIMNMAGLQFAAYCGLTTPIKNDVERLYRFCQAAFAAIDLFNTENGTELDVQIGMESGSLFGALIGTTAMAFEVWGPASERAQALSQYSSSGEITLSEAALSQLAKEVRKSAKSVKATLTSGEIVPAHRVQFDA